MKLAILLIALTSTAQLIDYRTQLKNRPYASITDSPFNAKGNGFTNDTQAFVNALASGANHIYCPKPSNFYNVTGPIYINNPIIFSGSCDIRNNGATSNLFVVRSSDVIIDGLTLRRTAAIVPDDISGMLVAIQANSADISNVKVQNVITYGSGAAAIGIIPNPGNFTASNIIISKIVSRTPVNTTSFTNQPSYSDVAIAGKTNGVIVEEIDGQGTNDFGINVLGLNSGGGTSPISSVKINKNIIRNKNRYGIIAYQSTAANTVNDVIIDNNTVENIRTRDIGFGFEYGMCIYAQTTNNLNISNNYVNNCLNGFTGNQLPPGAISINYGGTIAGGVSIVNNIVNNSKNVGIYAVLQPPKAFAPLNISLNSVRNSTNQGIIVRYFQGAQIANNTVDGGSGGIFMFTDADFANIQGNTLRPTTGSAIRVYQSVSPQVQTNQITKGVVGIQIENLSNNSFIVGNFVNGVSNAAVSLDNSDGLFIIDNALTGSLYGIFASATSKNVINGRNKFWANSQNIQMTAGATFASDSIANEFGIISFPTGNIGINQNIDTTDRIYVNGNIGSSGSVLFRGTNPFVGTITATDMRLGTQGIDAFMLYGVEKMPGPKACSFAELGTWAASTKAMFCYCNNCNPTTPCSSAGAGAWAFRTPASTQWKCPF